MRIVVTGASGFIGSHLCSALKDAGHEVVRIVRTAQADGDIAVGDLALFDGWHNIIQTGDRVIHLAGRVHQVKERHSDPEAAFQQANVVATKTLLDACAKAGVERFMLFSTIAVCGYDSGDMPFMPHQRAPYNPYSRSKANAESLVEASGIAFDIIRIPLAYGAGVRANFLSLMRLVDRRIPLPFASIHNQRDLVYVGNIVGAVIGLMEREQATNQILHITDGSPVSLPELSRAIGEALSKPVHLWPLPPSWINATTSLIGKDMIYHKLCSSLVMDTTTTRQQLAWTPPFTIDDGLQRTANWFMNQL